MKTKALTLIFLLLAYGASCFVPACIFAKKTIFNIAGNAEMVVYTPENTNSSFPIPLSSGQESSNTEEDFSQDDDKFINLANISFFRYTDSIPFHHLNNFILSGSLNSPFSPPEIRPC